MKHFPQRSCSFGAIPFRVDQRQIQVVAVRGDGENICAGDALNTGAVGECQADAFPGHGHREEGVDPVVVYDGEYAGFFKGSASPVTKDSLPGTQNKFIFCGIPQIYKEAFRLTGGAVSIRQYRMALVSHDTDLISQKKIRISRQFFHRQRHKGHVQLPIQDHLFQFKTIFLMNIH